MSLLKTNTFETDTGTIYYEVHGPNRPEPSLTLLHNIMSSGRSAWGAMLDDLSREFRVLLPDLPGHGRSQGYPDRFDHRLMARQLAALMDHEDVVNGHLAGASSGGMIAQQIVHDGLADPATLTLVSTTYSNDPETTGVERAVKPEHFQAGRRWLEATARLHDPHHYPGYFDEVLLAGYRQLTAEETINFTLDELGAWTMPVCIIHGSEDEFFSVQVAEDMARALPNAELHIVPQQSHSLIFRRPWAVQEILLDFLRRHATGHPVEEAQS